ncbi:hypothetical protein VSH64_14960 [Amycolatopsis rhabdoformis]|uniref:Sensor histidine kinase n=1 Tax=Amycolatopsis rhabdoformis TaxID=1448059 RepID=A0ABZ1IJ09_9PSEU|nr:hypothetical protein [Amycolatopsis rhabdoformis]WSE33400.1 hypothetical protein VSH64_14960 [Amycolatopsis rhabdoformis]
MTTGWIIGFSVGGAIVVVVVLLVLPILVLARSIGRAAPLINGELVAAERHTAALSELRTTIDHAEVITAGLRRGRARLGG